MTRILRRLSSLPVTATVLCLLPFLAVEAMAHVGEPGSGPVDRKMQAGQQGIGSATRLDGGAMRLDGSGANEQRVVRPSQACGLSFDAQRLSADALLAASVLGAPPLSEVRLDSVRAAGAVYRDVLSLLEGFDTASDIVLAAEGVTPEGVSCPLYVSVGSEGSRQSFWRFAPDDEPAGWFDEAGRRLGDAALAPPMRPGSRISSPFGPRRYYGRSSGGGFHDGIDFESRMGEPIFAAADGTVELRGGHFEYGLTVKIRHAPHHTTLYAHMSRFASDLAVGAPVRKGELIGYVGMTGRSTGAHLHFSTIVNGKAVDPAAYLSDTGNRWLSAPAFVTFRKWQEEIRAAVDGARDRRLRPPIEERDWTTRI